LPRGLTLAAIRPFDVATYIEGLQQEHSAPGVKQQLAAVRTLFDWLITVPHRREEPASYPAGRDRQKTPPLAAPRRSPDSRLQSGHALLPLRTRRHFLTLIDARFSP
jgi:hypothetical protein